MLQQTQATILCCLCGTQIAPNNANMCAQCLRTKHDLSAGISDEITIQQCRGCARWCRPPFVAAERESNELMAICLSRINGLSNVSLVETSWVWTEEHSRRLKVKLTVEKTVESDVTLQQQMVVTFVVRNQQCPDCNAQFTGGSWKSVVQVRQRVPHPRTLLYLEQLVLKHGAHEKAITIDRLQSGLDFYFTERSHGVRFADFVQSVLPCKSKMSKKLVSADNHSNTANQRFTTLVELPAISKHDLVVLPRRLASQLGNISQVVVVTGVQSSIFVVDPFTLQRATITADKYWRNPFEPLLASNSRALTEFMVLDSEPSDREPAEGADRRLRLADVEVARSRDMGVNDTTTSVTCHLGHLLQAGDLAMGFDLTSANLPESALEELRANVELPDVVLVRKHYPRRPNKKRHWKLKSLGAARIEGARPADQAREEQAQEEFMREIEEDVELRSQINLYSAGGPAGAAGAGAGAAGAAAVPDAEMDGGDDDLPPPIQLSELLDEMAVSERPPPPPAAAAGAAMEAEFALRSSSAPAGVVVNAAGVAFASPAAAAEGAGVTETEFDDL